MGLPDTSPVPKKDWMGMDYIPVYESEEQDDGKTVKVSLDKVQRSGVRTEAVEARVIVRPVRAVGTVMHDESRLTIVAMRSDAYIEELFVNKTGQHVHVGDPLFRVFSPDIVSAQVDLRNGGAEQRLRNLGVPESHIREVRAGKNPMSLVWPAPATGDVIEKRVINGQRVKAGDELYRIADHTHLWVIADVAESDLSAIKIGTSATVTVRAGRDENGARAHRAAESRRPLEDRHVCRCRAPDGSKRATRDRCPGQRRYRQRHPPDRAGRQGRRPLRAAPGQARPPG
jgi:membrane fusion protein, copper/silver efflux system